MLNQYGISTIKGESVRQEAATTESEVMTSTPIERSEKITPELSFSEKPTLNIQTV